MLMASGISIPYWLRDRLTTPYTKEVVDNYLDNPYKLYVFFRMFLPAKEPRTVVDPTDLLAACDVAEKIWQELPTQPIGVRRDIDQLWQAHAALVARSDGGQVPDAVLAVVTRSALLHATLMAIAAPGVRTDAILAAWRRAEAEVSETKAGSLPWLMMTQAVHAARAAYQARIAFVSSVSARVLGPIVSPG